MDLSDHSDGDISVPGSQGAQARSPNDHSDELDELEDDTEKTPAQILQESITDCPSAFLKFRVVSPQVAANQAKKKATAEKRKQTIARKREEKKNKAAGAEKQKNEDTLPHESASKEQKTSKSRKRKATEDVDDAISLSSEAEQRPSKKMKSKGKGKAAAKPRDSDSEDSDDVDITAYIYVERPVANAPTRTTSSSRAHKPTEEERFIARGVVMFSSSISFQEFLVSIAGQLPCAVDEIVQEKVTWKLQTPARSTYLALGGEIGFTSMIGQMRQRKPGTRIIMLAMPPPRKPLVEKPFWDDDNKTTFDYTELDVVSTHDHVVEQRVSFDKSVGPHKEALLERYPLDNNPLFPGLRIYFNTKMQTYFDLTDLKLNVWAAHLARGTATLDTPPISSHFDHKARITVIPKIEPAPSQPAGVGLAPTAGPVPPMAGALTSAATPSTGTTLMDIMLMNMIQQQQQQQLHFQSSIHAAVTAGTSNPGATSGTLPAHAAAAVAPAPAFQISSASSAPQSPAKFQLPDVSLADFCQRYAINATDQERLDKLEFLPGDKIDNLSEDDWKLFAGFTSLSWRRIIDKNHCFIRDARNGLWVPTL